MVTDDKSRPTASLFASQLTCNWPQAGLPIIYPPDVHQPWRSVYGFAIIAGQLAASQLMVLYCREDEIFGLMDTLNTRLADPASLQHAMTLLQRVRHQRLVKLAQLVEYQRVNSAANKRVNDVLGQVNPVPPRSDDEPKIKVIMEQLLSPQNPALEVTGLTKMLARLEVMLSALERVKRQGFHVVVRDRCRTPARPALEARRYESVASLNGDLPAGFLLPTQYHLTLWTYLVGAGDSGQSAVWN